MVSVPYTRYLPLKYNILLPTHLNMYVVRLMEKFESTSFTENT